MYAHFGATFYLLNCFEHGLAIALMIADFMSKQRDIIKTKREKFNRRKYEEDFDAFFDQQFAQTMGNLLRRLEKVFSISEILNLKMLEAKKRRDFLTHHFFRERAEDILTRAGLDRMITELESDQALFKAVDDELGKVMAPRRQELGIKDEFIEENFERILEQIKQSENAGGA